MPRQEGVTRLVAVGLVVLMALPLPALAQGSSAQPTFRQEELDQMLAPIALYPDALLAQILMAATYPLELVQADRWRLRNVQLQGNALTAALEQQSWDPSVKSLINFPQVLTMMSEQLDWTTNLGDAFIAQQKDVMDTVQTLRVKAQAAGNLTTTKELKVIVEQQIIRVESPSPQVIYVPTYNPTVVYGAWWYPAYPPTPYYPPGYVAGTALFAFGAGVALGSAWGHAWGGFNWHHGNVNIDINRNLNINRNINRQNYQVEVNRRGGTGGKGTWQHNATHRKGVAYRDRATATRYNRATPSDMSRARQNFRGRTATSQFSQSAGQRQGNRAGSAAKRSQAATANRAGSAARRSQVGTSSRASSSSRGGAFHGVNRGRGAQTYSNRGQVSRSSMAGSRGRGSGGGRRGGGRRR